MTSGINAFFTKQVCTTNFLGTESCEMTPDYGRITAATTLFLTSVTALCAYYSCKRCWKNRLHISPQTAEMAVGTALIITALNTFIKKYRTK